MRCYRGFKVTLKVTYFILGVKKIHCSVFTMIWPAFLKIHSCFFMKYRIFAVRMMGRQAGGDFSSMSERRGWLGPLG